MVKELRNKIFSQVLLVVSQVAFPLITYPVVTHALGPNGLGKVNFVDSIIQTLVILASLGIPLYGIREIAAHSRRKAEQSKIFSELFLLQLISLILALACLWFIGSTGKANPQLLAIGAMALIGNTLSFDWVLQGNEKFFFLAIRAFFIRLIAAILIFTLVKNANDCDLYYGILSVSVIASMVLNAMAIFSIVKFSFTRISLWLHIKKIKWIYACYLAASMYAVVDSIVLGWMSTDAAVGYYSFAYRLIRMSAMLVPTLGVVFIPRIAFHFALANKLEVKRQITQSAQLILFLSIPISLAFFLLAPEIVDVFAGNKFQPTIAVCQILSPLPFLVALSHLTGSQILLSTKKEKLYFLVLGVGILINVALDVILIPRLREIAPAIANVSVESFVMFATIIYLHKKDVFQFPFKYFTICVLCALPLFLVTYLLRLLELSSLLIILVSLAVTGLIYVIIHLKFLPESFVRTLFTYNTLSQKTVIETK